MTKFVVSDSSFIFTPDPGWNFQTWDGILSIQLNNDSLFKINQNDVMVENDIYTLSSKLDGKYYRANAFTTPGQLKAMSILIDQNTLCKYSSINNVPIVNDKTSGTFTMSLISPALTPKGDPDPVFIKSGKWKVHDIPQQFVKEIIGG